MTHPPDTPPEEEGSHFVGEEEGDGRSTPAKNLAAAVAIGALAIFAMALALRMPVPQSLFTAPGLLPFLTGLSLLAMSAALGVMAVREGAGQDIRGAVSRSVRGFLGDEENQRTLFLIAIIFIYVVLVDLISFDLRLPTGVFVLRFGSYELVSIVILTGVLRLFWKAALVRCFAVSFGAVVALASIFRYAFKILLPGSG